jgi:mono/diheme cytochrome c family protein
VRVAGLSVLLGTIAVVLAACGGTSGPGISSGGSLDNGRTIFNEGWSGGQSCASCHTLEAAGPLAVGKIGPDLDNAFRGAREQGFEESTFQQVVREQIAYPGIGLGMPADLVQGQDADDVAYFVARCAANTDDPACKPQEGGGQIAATDGKEIFASAGCASCHTLAAAGATGAVGPNLDESRPALDLVVDRVTNGQGGMPPFEDRLSEEQIQAVAEFVSQSAGK